MRMTIPVDAKVSAVFGDWTLYELAPRADDSFLWVKFKLMLPPTAPAKHGATRVYRLAWNIAEQRFAKDRKLIDLMAQHADLYAAVELHLGLEYGSDRLEATPEEIAAEVKRLREMKKGKKTSRAAPAGVATTGADALAKAGR